MSKKTNKKNHELHTKWSRQAIFLTVTYVLFVVVEWLPSERDGSYPNIVKTSLPLQATSHH